VCCHHISCDLHVQQVGERSGTFTGVDDEVTNARPLVAAARSVVVLSGAGISTDSGIPDFRGPNGVWTRNPKAERMSNLQEYLGNPEVRRASWQNRLTAPAWDALPNAGHRAVVELERQGRLRAVVTQNIDELHQRAGTHPSLVHELHGSMWGWVCWSCGATGPMTAMLERVRAGEDDPDCPACGGVVKSTTISFGQNLDPDVLEASVEAVLGADLVLVVGSTLQVHPAAGLVPLAVRAGIAVVIVNADPTPYDDAAAAIVRTPISDALPALVGG
jgi:NAD-dependent deacetylase